MDAGKGKAEAALERLTLAIGALALAEMMCGAAGDDEAAFRRVKEAHNNLMDEGRSALAVLQEIKDRRDAERACAEALEEE